MNDEWDETPETLSADIAAHVNGDGSITIDGTLDREEIPAMIEWLRSKSEDQS